MSEMSYLEKLLDGVHVEWVTLGSMADIGTGSSNRQDESENGIYPFFVRSKNILKSDTFEFDEVAIVIPGEGGIGDIFHYIEGKYALHQRAYRISIQSDSLNTKFLYYFMLSHFKQYILMKSVGATAISIRKPMLEGFKVPIPCPDNPEKSLAIQAEIVRILDTFTALTAELTAELSMCKKQYNYYCDQLLNFDGNIPVVQLSDCCVSISDGDHQAPPKTDSGIPFITISNVTHSNTIDFENTYFVSDDYYQRIHDKRRARKKDILYTVVGSIGIPVYIDFDMKFAFQRHIAILRADEQKIIPKYLYHVMRSSAFLKKANSVAVGAAQKTITLSALNKMNVPIPPIGEQERIVNILDKFDILTNSLSEGLPREIELRQKQYEYYRDMLFSFPRPDVVEA